MKKDGRELILSDRNGDVRCRNLVNCAGLQSDRVARLCGVKPGLQIIPFRGEYYELVPGRRDLVRNLIYPVPDPQFPFLGVHFTRMIAGGVEAGPNAVLAFKRHGYTKTSFSLRDAAQFALYPGFWAMGLKFWKMGLGEFYRSFSKKAFVRALQRLVPEIQAGDLVARRRRRPRPGAGGQRFPGRRFPHPRSRAHGPRAERPVAGRHGFDQHRRIHRRPGPEKFLPFPQGDRARVGTLVPQGDRARRRAAEAAGVSMELSH